MKPKKPLEPKSGAGGVLVWTTGFCRHQLHQIPLVLGYDYLLGRHESSAAEIWRTNALRGVLKLCSKIGPAIGIIVTNLSMSPFLGSWIPGSPDLLARTHFRHPIMRSLNGQAFRPRPLGLPRLVAPHIC